MGGHSHWSTIKRKKGSEDAKRGKIFTKIIREITTAARLGGGDPNVNPRLRLTIAKAKDANMPADNIKKAIMRGTGELPGITYEETIYEGYGPNGIAILVEISSDNRNRTVSEIRNLFDKHGGRMGEAGCVAWMFTKKGQLVIERSSVNEEKLMNLVLESGAEDLQMDDNCFEVITSFSGFEKVRKAIEDQQIPMVSAEITHIPQSTVRLDGKEAEQVLRLVEVLEDHDDVQGVHANFDIPQAVMEKVGSSQGR